MKNIILVPVLIAFFSTTMIKGQSILSIIHQRILRANKSLNVVVATSKEKSDDPIIRKCERLNIPYFNSIAKA